MCIPNELLLDNIAPYLQLSDRTRMTAVSRFFHHRFKRQDLGKELPRVVKVVTIWDFLSEGGFDPLHGDDLYKALTSAPFRMETMTPIPVGIRTWEPVINLDVDLTETFFRKEDRSLVKGIKYSFQFLDEWFGSRVKIEVTSLSMTAGEDDPPYLIGFCETEKQKSPLLFGVKKKLRYEITTALTSTKI